MFSSQSFLMYIIIAFILTQVGRLLKVLSRLILLNRNVIKLYRVVGEVAKYFRLLNTLVHEIGHIVLGRLTGSKPVKIDLFKDTSGLATRTIHKQNKLGGFLTTIAGYPTASAVAFLAVYTLHIGRADLVLSVAIGVVAVGLILWVRNGFGILWSVVFIVLSGSMILYASEDVLTGYTLMIVAILVVESLFSALTVFKITTTRDTRPNDARTLSTITGLPQTFWGLLFFGQAVYFTYLGYAYWL